MKQVRFASEDPKIWVNTNNRKIPMTELTDLQLETAITRYIGHKQTMENESQAFKRDIEFRLKQLALEWFKRTQAKPLVFDKAMLNKVILESL